VETYQRLNVVSHILVDVACVLEDRGQFLYFYHLELEKLLYIAIHDDKTKSDGQKERHRVIRAQLHLPLLQDGLITEVSLRDQDRHLSTKALRTTMLS
jgi:hypothetical protein